MADLADTAESLLALSRGVADDGDEQPEVASVEAGGVGETRARKRKATA
jgi:hypothetical protein